MLCFLHACHLIVMSGRFARQHPGFTVSYTCTYRHTCAHTQTYTYRHTRTWLHFYIHTHTHIHIHTYTNIHTYTCIHACTQHTHTNMLYVCVVCQSCHSKCKPCRTVSKSSASPTMSNRVGRILNVPCRTVSKRVLLFRARHDHVGVAWAHI